MTKNPENMTGDDYVAEVRKELGFTNPSIIAIHETDKPTVWPANEVIRVLGERLAHVSQQLNEERKTVERLRESHVHNEALIARYQNLCPEQIGECSAQCSMTLQKQIQSITHRQDIAAARNPVRKSYRSQNAQ